IVRTAEGSGREGGGVLPVGLTAQMNALGLLGISCVSADPAVQQSWPLEFNVREHVEGVAGGVPRTGRKGEAIAPMKPNSAADALETARKQIEMVFTQSDNSSKKNKITAAAVLRSIERILASARSEWNGPLLRALWPALEERRGERRRSADHEE